MGRTNVSVSFAVRDDEKEQRASSQVIVVSAMFSSDRR